MRRLTLLLLLAVACGGEPVDPVRVLDEPLPGLARTRPDRNTVV
jgi:hypothetical protein